MKKLIAVLAVGLMTVVGNSQTVDDWENGVRTSVTLEWDAPAPGEEIERYRLFAADELPAGQTEENPQPDPAWVFLVEVTEEDARIEVDGSIVYRLKLTNQTPRKRFYVLVAVNYWGLESPFSNAAHTPPPVTSRGVLRIKR